MSTNERTQQRELMNTSLKVCKLPPEILIYIFQLVQQIFSWSRTHAACNVEWLPITWVCRRWRAVALSAPILWNRIISPRPINPYVHFNLQDAWVQTFLDRAAGATLDVFVSMHPDYAQEMLLHVLPHAPFFRSLTLSYLNCACSGPHCNILAAVASRMQEMYALEAFTLMLYSCSSAKELITLPLHRCLRLRDVNIHVDHFPWANISDFASRLRSLTLTKDTSRPSLPSFLSLLRSAPQLTHLVLKRCLPKPPHSFDYRSTEGSVSFPNLKSLEIDDECKGTLYVCTQIAVSPNCTIKISRSIPPTHPDEELEAIDPVPSFGIAQPIFMPFLLMACSAVLVVDWGSFHLNVSGDRSAIITHSASCRPSCHAPLADGTQVAISVSCIEPWPGPAEPPCIYPRAWDDLTKTLSAAPLTHLTVGARSLGSMSMEMWRECLARFPLLQFLAIDGLGDLEDNGVLPEDEETMGRRTSGSYPMGDAAVWALVAPTRLEEEPLCPHLCLLELSNFECLTLGNIFPLARMLVARDERGVSVPELVFYGCSFGNAGDAKIAKERLEELTKVAINYMHSEGPLDFGHYVGEDEFRVERRPAIASV